MAHIMPKEDAARMHSRSGISRVKRVPRDTQFLAYPSVAIALTTVGNSKRVVTVKFDMGQSSIAESNREGLS